MARKPQLDIETYNRKRDFTRTKEPKGRKLKGKGDSFVVQKHEASRLHWDFRLELDGVLKSWAVPKGPSLDPDDKRLAVRTEDHPLDYGDFEGVIPKGEYGGGTVMLWDKGRWEPEPGKDPSQTIEEGHLHFTLEGERMKGEWVMFRLKGRPGDRQEPWMLKKVDDQFARPDEGEALVEQCVSSVTTDRSMAEIAAGTDVWHSNRKATGKAGRAKRKAGVGPPKFQAPQLATLVDAVPGGNDWLHEYKYDGYRLLVSTAGGAATAFTRNGHDWSDKFRPIVRAAAKLSAGCLIDGEAVALDKKGKPSFQLLQASLKGDDADLAFYAFDLLVDQGEDITKLSNIERKERLAALLKTAGPPIVYGDHVIGKGEALFDAICKEGGEGIVSKKADAPYKGARAKNWLKVKCIQRQEFVIVGWQDSDKRQGFRSLHLGVRKGRKLTYAGKVGTGFDTRMIHDLADRMRPLEIEEPALDVPRAALRQSHWVKPTLVGEVAFTEFTREGTLRHPSFIALREDKPATEVVLEKPEKLSKARKLAKADRAPADNSGIKITNPDRVIYPGDGLTKGDLAHYYSSIEALMLVDMAKRPISLVRCPQGRAKQCFFQKHDSGTMGPHVKHVPIEESDGEVQDYLYVQDARGILACVQMGTVEFHGWGSKANKLEYPDRLVFDLDPDEGLDFNKVKVAAVRLRTLLADLGLVTFPMLTGGKGIHVIAPLDAKSDWPKVKSFAERFSRAIAEAEPGMFTANIRKNQRKGRIFLDWLRNQRGATAVMPYSARAREGAPVAAPISWEELDKMKSGAAFSIRDADELLKRAASKQLAGWGQAKQKLPRA
jgi:bifunctional non-homologous end joining protein LigD